jgi:hypothetical protein
MQPDPAEAAAYWLSQTIQAAHMLDGWVRSGAPLDATEHHDIAAHMLRRLADQIEAAAQNKRAA